jgi:3-oxoacyl-[acyl-carrier-protein] synthase-3
MKLTVTGKSVGILGTGSSLPEKVLTNFDIEKMVETSDDWIIRRTGISERRILEKNIPAYEMGTDAALKALKSASLSPEDIDLIIVATATPDYLTPMTATIIQGRINAVNAAAFDMNAACTGFIYAVTVAKQFIMSGTSKHVFVIGCKALSRVVDYEDRNTCILFGDAAGAVVLGEVEPGYGIITEFLASDGANGYNITIPCCHLEDADKEKRLHENKKVIWMDGSVVLKFAVRSMESATRKVLEKAGMKVEDLQYIFPHQANIRIIDGALERLGLSADKVPMIIHKYGNISSASIPVALDEAANEGRLSKGNNLVMVGFGGGLTWGSILLKWNK